MLFSIPSMQRVACREEKVELIKIIEKLRSELEAKIKSTEEDNTSLIDTVVNVRKEFEDLKEANEQLREGKAYVEYVKAAFMNERKQLHELKENNEKLQQGKAACFRDMQELKVEREHYNNNTNTKQCQWFTNC